MSIKFLNQNVITNIVRPTGYKYPNGLNVIIPAADATSVTFVLCGGGGGGGSSSTTGTWRGAGGGAGGLVYGVGYPLTALTGYPVTIGGAGGAGSSSTPGSPGSASTAFGFQANGGGGGGSSNGGSNNPGAAGASGGSGGGSAGGGPASAVPATQPSANPGAPGAISQYGTSGGGGNPAGFAAGNGGGAVSLSGLSLSLTGSTFEYSRGGGEGSSGPSGPSVYGTPAFGGGGNGNNTPSGFAANNGVLVVVYSGSQAATGGTVSTVGANTVHVFTSPGTFTPNTPSSIIYSVN